MSDHKKRFREHFKLPSWETFTRDFEMGTILTLDIFVESDSRHTISEDTVYLPCLDNQQTPWHKA